MKMFPLESAEEMLQQPAEWLDTESIVWDGQEIFIITWQVLHGSGSEVTPQCHDWSFSVWH